MEFEIRDTPKGQGLFAREFIPNGGLILTFRGPRLEEMPPGPDLFLQVGPNQYIGPSGGADDYPNHSCEPNGVVLLEPTPCLISLEDIHPGEEITFDYSLTCADPQWSMTCNCGAPNCRRLIGPYWDMPQSLRDRYEALGFTPAYLRNRSV